MVTVAMNWVRARVRAGVRVGVRLRVRLGGRVRVRARVRVRVSLGVLHERHLAVGPPEDVDSTLQRVEGLAHLLLRPAQG